MWKTRVFPGQRGGKRVFLAVERGGMRSGKGLFTVDETAGAGMAPAERTGGRRHCFIIKKQMKHVRKFSDSKIIKTENNGKIKKEDNKRNAGGNADVKKFSTAGGRDRSTAPGDGENRSRVKTGTG